MLSLLEFGELRRLWLIFIQEVEQSYHYIEKDGKRCLTNIDAMHTRRCHKRAIAVENAIKCLIAKYPAAIFYAFVCPEIGPQHRKELTRHDSA